MVNNEFPSNTKSSPRKEPNEPKVVERVVVNEALPNKKPLSRRLREIFMGGDTKSVFEHVVLEVLIPQAKEMISEAMVQTVERMIFGENRPTRTRQTSRYGSSASGYTNYHNRYTTPRGPNPIPRTPRDDRPSNPSARVRPDETDEILLASRVEADTVLERMYDLLDRYEVVTKSDLKQLIGWTASHTDHKWGWVDLEGSTMRRVRDGYVLVLPAPEPLD